MALPGSSPFPCAVLADRLTPSRRDNKIQWCAIGRDEKKKCDVWSVMSNGDVECVVAEDTKECITKIMVQLFSPFLLTVNFLGASFTIPTGLGVCSVSFLHFSLAER